MGIFGTYLCPTLNIPIIVYKRCEKRIWMTYGVFAKINHKDNFARIKETKNKQPPIAFPATQFN